MFIVFNLSGGGAERVLSILSNALLDFGCDISIILQRRENQEYFINSKIKIFSLETLGLDCKKGSKVSRTYKRIKILRGIIDKQKPDYIFPFLGNMIRDSYLASLGTKIKVIAALRVNPENMPMFDRFCLNFVFNHCDAVFLQTISQRCFLSDRAVRKSFVVPNPVSLDIIAAGIEKKYSSLFTKIITCGRLNEQKNHELLIEAVVLVHQIHPEITLDIYGDGHFEEFLKSLIKKRKADRYIFLKGRTNNIKDVLLHADMFVLSSNYEGMPNALMEAMAVGLPCISTDCLTGPKELIGNNKRGMLVEVNNLSQMKRAICRLIEETDLSINYGKKARLYILENYTPAIIARKLLNNIENI